MSLVRVLGTLSSLIVFFTDSEEGFLLAPQQSVLQPGVGIHPQMSSVRLSGATRREFREKEKVIQIISSVFTFLASVCVCVCVLFVCVCALCACGSILLVFGAACLGRKPGARKGWNWNKTCAFYCYSFVVWRAALILPPSSFYFVHQTSFFLKNT